jgi:phosphocarrier protein HPr
MTERTATIASRVGLHARPAAVFAEAATATGLDVTIAAASDPATAVDASSILGLMGLGAKHGDTVVLQTDETGADDALDGLVAILQTDHDAE